MTEIDTNSNECDSEAETEVDESEVYNNEEIFETDDNGAVNDGDNKDLKCGAPECKHLRFKSQREREEHWESNMECVFYNI